MRSRRLSSTQADRFLSIRPSSRRTGQVLRSRTIAHGYIAAGAVAHFSETPTPHRKRSFGAGNAELNQPKLADKTALRPAFRHSAMTCDDRYDVELKLQGYAGTFG